MAEQAQLLHCYACKEMKPDTEFHRARNFPWRNFRRYQCKTCAAAYHQARMKNPRIRERMLAHSRRWARDNRDRAVALQRLRRYGIQPDVYDEMFRAQGGLCAICTRAFDSLNVDHDHKTGLVRGLLCGDCNRAIGLLRDDPFAAAAAARYLKVQ